MITKKQVKRQYGATSVKQFGSKQLFLVDNRLLVIYLTVVARLDIGTGVWTVTDTKHSPSTTRQINYWIREYKPNFRYGTV